jgi:hypothetical protein
MLELANAAVVATDLNGQIALNKAENRPAASGHRKTETTRWAALKGSRHQIPVFAGHGPRGVVERPGHQTAAHGSFESRGVTERFVTLLAAGADDCHSIEGWWSCPANTPTRGARNHGPR